MADKQSTATATVIPLRPSETPKSSERKWGAAVMKLGFTVLPSLIFRAQARLGLSPTHLAVLLQIADHWWEHERKPYPGTKALGERLSLSPRQVRRHIADLEKAELIKRIERRGAHRGKLTNLYDLGGLVEKLKKLEPEFREVQEMKRKVGRRGGLNLKHKAPEDKKPKG
ncbi:MAG: helix-turn-helix domain-containing protein [Burkholderiales bacterium]|nr:helix-turn-helix domain-containing protein [Burkholderiales bacterium]